jgi:myo-inositol 2-dehydrogenase/D-chiro-inositol 1-dehydrogenase
MGRTNAETVSRYLDRARLVAIAGGTRASSLAAEYGVTCEPSVNALLARPDIDAVLISTPHCDHADQAVAAASAGKHILLDKPMATSCAECDRILDAVRAARVKLMIMYGQRFRICNMEARRLIREGVIGNVRMIMELMLATGGLAALPPWQNRPQNVGTLLGHAVHNIDRIRWLTGAEITSVSALVHRDPSTGVEQSTMALLGLNNGAMATLWESWGVAPPLFPRSSCGAWIAGDLGSLDLDAYGTLKLGRGTDWTVVAEQAPIDWKGQGMLSPVRIKSYQLQHQEFVNAILEDREPSATGLDGRAAVAVAEAAYRSAATGQTIAVDEWKP